MQKGIHRQGLGSSRGDFTSKLHTDADGWPLGLLSAPGETHDAKVAIGLATRVRQRPLTWPGDRGYDTGDIRYADWGRSTLPMIPTRATHRFSHRDSYQPA